MSCNFASFTSFLTRKRLVVQISCNWIFCWSIAAKKQFYPVPCRQVMTREKLSQQKHIPTPQETKTSTKKYHNPSYIEARTSSHQRRLLSFAQVGMWRRTEGEEAWRKVWDFYIFLLDSYISHDITNCFWIFSWCLSTCLRRNPPDGLQKLGFHWPATTKNNCWMGSTNIKWQHLKSKTSRWGHILIKQFIKLFPTETLDLHKLHRLAFCERVALPTFNQPGICSSWINSQLKCSWTSCISPSWRRGEVLGY